MLPTRIDLPGSVECCGSQGVEFIEFIKRCTAIFNLKRLSPPSPDLTWSKMSYLYDLSQTK